MGINLHSSSLLMRGKGFGMVNIAPRLTAVMAMLFAFSFQGQAEERASQIHGDMHDHSQEDRLISFTKEEAALIPELHAPVDCSDASVCFVQILPDWAESKNNVEDFKEGVLSVEGARSTVFRATSVAQMYKGIPVKAVGRGLVRSVRANMPDFVQKDENYLRWRECGNGILLDLDRGWTVQYCHLKEGSLTVRPGDVVNAGDVIGYMGASGLAAYPQLEITVKHNGRFIDPYHVTDYTDMWKIGEVEKIPYRKAGVLHMAFLERVPTKKDMFEGFEESEVQEVLRTAKQLFFWAHVFGAEEGDILELEIEDSIGESFVKKRTQINHSSKTHYSYVGKQVKILELAPGTWVGKLRVYRPTYSQRDFREGKLKDEDLTYEVLLAYDRKIEVK